MVAPSETQAKWVLDHAHTVVEFSAKHMVISNVKGRFSKFDANINFDEEHPERSSLEATVDLASVDTNEPRRDGHLRSPDFFDVEKFPQMTFKSRSVEPNGKDRYKMIGDLTIRDVTREIVLDVTMEGKAKDPMGNWHVGFSAEGRISREDFGLTWNVALETGGWLVGDAIKISIETELIKQGQE